MLIEIIGWIGSVMVIVAYALSMNKVISVDDKMYYGLNIIGSIFLILNTYYHHSIPSMMVNVVWVLVAFFSISRKFFFTGKKSD